MGTVWRAEQLSTRREVALKLMAAVRFDSAKAQVRFEREVELTARLDHPNIARVYDSGLHHGMYYYAMELVDGTPLDRYVKSNNLSKNQILVLMQKVCQAVLYAHLRAVIHRDLKPSNILVDPGGQPHVLDFGLAKALLEDDEALTISVEGQVAGTPAYMSPEQAAGRHDETDTRTDVFSLGVILYELLTGQSPHDRS
jgi:serine/threonine protein kinase